MVEAEMKHDKSDSSNQMNSNNNPNQSQGGKRNRNKKRGGNRGGGGNQANDGNFEGQQQFQQKKQNFKKNQNQGFGGSAAAGDQQMSTQEIYSSFFNKQQSSQQPMVQQYQPKKQQQNKNFNSMSNFSAGPVMKVNENDVVPSKEDGFTGPPSEWFDEDVYKKQMISDFGDRDKHDYYFGSYSSFHIHEEMLKDTVRTRTYQRAIMDNPEDFKDKIVLDIGAGTGILSMFAARAGAKHVYAIEFAEIAIFAREIIKKNGLEDKITVIKGKMEEIQLPEKNVDIIISEWMGYFLLYESMLDSVLWARDKYLVKGGKMLPDRAQIYVAALEDGQYKNQKRTFWNDVYSFDMSCMTPTVMKEPLVDTVNKDSVMSEPCKILDLDLVHCKKEDVEFSSEYALKMLYTDRVHGLIAWFDTPFQNLTRPVNLSTSPFKKYTHWKQVVFYMDQDIDVREGDCLYGSIAARKSTANFRELEVKISYHFDHGRNPKNFTNLYKIK